jgi:3-methyl-2-oxobutanoate hydroxymethyltransferase
MGAKMMISDLAEAKKKQKKIVAISCYDYISASLCRDAGVDVLLVGDSAAQWLLGFDSTLGATMDFMVAITAAVGRGGQGIFLVADMPFLSYHTGTSDAIKNAGRFIVEAKAQMVKIEATESQIDIIKAVSGAGIAVMAHIGMTPQSGELKAVGATAESAHNLIGLARQLIEAGARALLLEGVTREVAKIITQNSSVPVISCGSGPDCDGQVLILPDVLGLLDGPGPKFSKSFANLASAVVEGVKSYADQVRSSAFPDDDHCYHIKSSDRAEIEKIN